MNPRELKPEKFENLAERTVDKRSQVWLIHLMDAFEGVSDENADDLHPGFGGLLRRSLEKAGWGAAVSLNTYRRELGR